MRCWCWAINFPSPLSIKLAGEGENGKTVFRENANVNRNFSAGVRWIGRLTRSAITHPTPTWAEDAQSRFIACMSETTFSREFLCKSSSSLHAKTLKQCFSVGSRRATMGLVGCEWKIRNIKRGGGGRDTTTTSDGRVEIASIIIHFCCKDFMLNQIDEAIWWASAGRSGLGEWGVVRQHTAYISHAIRLEEGKWSIKVWGPQADERRKRRRKSLAESKMFSMRSRKTFIHRRIGSTWKVYSTATTVSLFLGVKSFTLSALVVALHRITKEAFSFY